MRASTLSSTLVRTLLSLAPLALAACSIIGGSKDDPATSDNAVNGTPPPAAKATTGAKTTAPGTPGVAPKDGMKDGTETDVDCGGSGNAARCADGKKCKDASDCTSMVCDGATCQAPTATDGVQNGDESDVDCGGTTTGAPKCDVGKACKVHADCDSDGCGYDNKCAVAKSCTSHMGGDTCGVGEVGDPAAKHESCCNTATLPNSNAKIDKYLVTAGRMRTMIDRLNGDVRSYVKTLPAGTWNQSWNALVPSNKAEADDILGSYFADAPNDPGGGGSKRSCGAGDYTGRTFWTPPNGTDYSDFSKDQLDVKALNCVGWHLMTAFCSWDGGRLGTRQELVAAYTNGGTTQYPWQWHDNRPYTATVQDDRLNHVFSYNFPNVANMRTSNGNALDIAYHVSPPGRTPNGWNAQGVEIAGNLLTWVKDAEYYFTWNFSWENHTDNGNQAQSWLVTAPEAPNGYYGIGGRCLHD